MFFKLSVLQKPLALLVKIVGRICIIYLIIYVKVPELSISYQYNFQCKSPFSHSSNIFKSDELFDSVGVVLGDFSFFKCDFLMFMPFSNIS